MCVVGDQGYQAFRGWIEDVAAIKKETYTKATDLPPKDGGPKQFGSEAWLKLEKTPDAWSDKLLQADVHAWDAKAGAWEPAPVATSDRVVFRNGKLWQHTLTLVAAPGSERAQAWSKGKASLPPGRYLLKVYVDSTDKAKKDWKAPPGTGEYAGQAEFEARGGEGYGARTVVDAGAMKK